MPFSIHTSVFDNSEQFFFGHHLLLVQAVAIGRFADEIVALGEELGRRKDMTVLATDIAGISETLPAFLVVGRLSLVVGITFIDLKAAYRSAEHVTGVGESEQHIIEKAETAVVTVSDEMLHRLIHIHLRIERFDEVFLAFLLMRMLLVDLLVVRPHILLLNERRIGEHEGAQVARGWRTVDVALEAHFDDIGNEPGMVDMGMRKHNAIQRSRIKAQVSVGGIGLHAFTLVHTAIEENSVTGIGGDQMLATRHLTSGT